MQAVKNLWKWGRDPTLHFSKFWRIYNLYFRSLMTHFTDETGKLLFTLSSSAYLQRWTMFPQETLHCSGLRGSVPPRCCLGTVTHAQENSSMWPVRTAGVCLAPRHQSCLSCLSSSYALLSLYRLWFCITVHRGHTCMYAHLSPTTLIKAVYTKAVTILD